MTHVTDAMFNLIGIDVIACPDSWQAVIDNGMQCGTFGGTVSNFQILWDSYASVPASPVTTAKDWRTFDEGELKTMNFGELGYTVYIQDLDDARFVAIMYSNPSGAFNIGQHRQLAYSVMHDVGAEVVECDDPLPNLVCAVIDGTLNDLTLEIDFALTGYPNIRAAEAEWRYVGDENFETALHGFSYEGLVHMISLIEEANTHDRFNLIWAIYTE